MKNKIITALGITGVFALGATFALAVLAFATYKHPARGPSPDFSSIPGSNGKRIDWAYSFDPKPDITPYELALSLNMITGYNQYRPEGVKPWYDLMPESVKRHWTAPTQPPPTTAPTAPVPPHQH